MTDHNKPFVSCRCRCRCCRVLRKVPNVLKSGNCKTDAVNISLTRDVTSLGMAVPFSDCMIRFGYSYEDLPKTIYTPYSLDCGA